MSFSLAVSKIPDFHEVVLDERGAHQADGSQQERTVFLRHVAVGSEA
jgi:hypothetical protein